MLCGAVVVECGVKHMIQVGTKAVCRLYNTPKQCFYGDQWTGKVVSIDKDSKKPYIMTRPGHPNIALHRYELRSLLPDTEGEV